ncbi:hypothetical protein ABZ070_09260 [Streptomyces sp. NPDC006283]|uniref:hypothetical protein n=1 Tax=Streptomyces sp. NPDC006283 TaxID=3156741 RepID=UPI0033AAA58F
MRSTAVRRTALAAAAASLVLLVTACGGDGSGGDGDTKDKGGETGAAEPAAKALTVAELEKLAIAQGDVKGHKVAKAGPQDDIAAKDVTTDQAECLPLARALAGVPVGEPGATVKRRATAEPKDAGKDAGDMTEEELGDAFTDAFDITTTLLALSSYEGKGAADGFAALKTAGTACSGGFTMTVAGTEQKVQKFAEAKVSGGDEAVAWAMTADQGGESLPFNLAVVRKGGSLVTFSSFNLTAPTEKGDLPLPTAVIDAQAAKLG